MKNHSPHFTHRGFIRSSAAGAAAFAIVPGSVLGLRGAASPNGKLNLAAIGVGGQGGGDLNNLASENIVALCDVDSERAAASSRKFPGAKQFQDFRRRFDAMEKQIDAVLTPMGRSQGAIHK